MRRKDKEITDRNQIKEILDTCMVCRLGLYDPASREVYIVPMNFAYELQGEDLTLYFHSAREGRKLTLLKEHPSVGFEMDCHHQLIPHKLPCEYSYQYRSIIGSGTCHFLDNPAQKAAVLSLLMKKQAGADIAIDEARTASVSVFAIKVKTWSCKAG